MTCQRSDGEVDCREDPREGYNGSPNGGCPADEYIGSGRGQCFPFPAGCVGAHAVVLKQAGKCGSAYIGGDGLLLQASAE